MMFQYHELHNLKVNMVSLLCNTLHIKQDSIGWRRFTTLARKQTPQKQLSENLPYLSCITITVARINHEMPY